MQEWTGAKQYTDPEKMAAAYLVKYYGNQKIEYPINPFKMLKDEGILFSLMDFKKLEGVYVPASSLEDVPLVGTIHHKWTAPVSIRESLYEKAA